jgi:hypothetical protein
MINLHMRVAVLIDADNAQQYTEQVLKISEYYGELEICRAYGDWNQRRLSSYQKTLEALEIECIQVDQGGKNASDNYLLMDAGRILGREISTDVHIFIIVSGDGDFTSGCKLIQEAGREVIVIGNKKQTSKSLQKSCNKFYALEDLKDELIELKELHPIPPREIRRFYPCLLRAYHQFTRKEYLWISYGQLNAKLHEIVPDFENKFGKYELSQWLRNYKQYFESNDKEQILRRIDSDLEYARYEALLHAYIDTKGPDDLAPLAQFSEVLRRDPNYQYRFGNKKPSKWLRDYPDNFEIRGNHAILKNLR